MTLSSDPAPPIDHAVPSAPVPDTPRPAPPLVTWRWSAPAWHCARLLTRRRINLLLRVRSARLLPASARARFLAMGLTPSVVDDTLGEVRSLAGWADAWTRTAQRFLGEARRYHPESDREQIALARRQAALCYHVAQLMVFNDPRAARALRATATTLFAQAAPFLTPPPRRVLIPWRAKSLPGYLVLPAETASSAPVPLVILLNGATTAKEETIQWNERFCRRGFATLALDWPGTGEAAELIRAGADLDDVANGIIELAAAEGRLDAARVCLVGLSLGGALAVRAAAYDRRVAACVAVTPPFQAADWLGRANTVVLDQLAAVIGDATALPELAQHYALADRVPRLRAPLLVLGAGRDLVVPPGESVRLAAAAGDLATLIWYPRAGHGLYDRVAEWTDDVARWLEVVLPPPSPPSTRVDPGLRRTAAQDPGPSGGHPQRDTPTTVTEHPDQPTRNPA